MRFPNDTLERIQEPNQTLVEIYAVAGEVDDSGAKMEPILSTWQPISLDASGLEVKLVFSSPIQVSQKDKADILFV